jgi:site-specific recombinase XerD
VRLATADPETTAEVAPKGSTAEREHTFWIADFSHLLSRPRSGPLDHLASDEIVALLPSLPDWPLPEALAGPAGKGARAHMYRCTNGVRRILSWLLAHPGDGWQERWLNAGGDDLAWIAACDPADLRSAGTKRNEITSGLGCLMLLRVVIVSYDCLNAHKSGRFLARVRRVLRPDLFDRVEQAAVDRGVSGEHLFQPMAVLSRLVLQTGRDLDQLKADDLLALFSWGLRRGGPRSFGVHIAWEMLSVLGVTEPGTTLRNTALRGQRPSSELVDDFGIQCAPIRDLLIRYLDERRASYDYTSLRDTAGILAGSFWSDIEKHHPGIDTLHLSTPVIAAWKERVAVVVGSDGTVRPRKDVLRMLTRVRAFYLDIQQWALEDPAWAPWAVPSPITRRDTQGLKKVVKARQAKMHQRVRERLPQLPALADHAEQRRSEHAALLALATSAEVGENFTHRGTRYLRTGWKTRNRVLAPQGIRVRNLASAETFDLTRREDEIFWSWAIIETLRHTGVRIEELLELTHLALVSYRLPDTAELVPLLQIAPSKSNEERLLLVGPELASVLATIITRLRSINGGSVKLISRFDTYERSASAPLPHLFQRSRGGRSLVISPPTANKLINKAIAAANLMNTSGQPLTCTAHDFRRMFATEIVANGLPVHIAARLLGHASLATTQAYLAVFQEDLIRSYRSFLDQRRSSRPASEYREPTDEEWTEFQQHFQVRKLELGDCGRPYGTPCSHEHACIRCPMLRVDPRQRDRLIGIIRNLTDRITEATMNGWLGEARGLTTSLQAANGKLASLTRTDGSRRPVTDLGIPIIPGSR